MDITHKSADIRVDDIVKLKQNTKLIVSGGYMPDQGTVEIPKRKIPIAKIVEPAYLAIDPYTNPVTQKLAGSVVFQTDIREVKVMHKPKLVNADMQLTVAKNKRSSHSKNLLREYVGSPSGDNGHPEAHS
jgi:hypothetical protein